MWKDLEQDIKQAEQLGSPPRVRERLLNVPVTLAVAGITPVYAGKTYFLPASHALG